ncbi:MAG TPA: amino acid adenylation domain-containing protein, partial [Ktedonobacteraceae bacterium]|nr:amino acid adenylation domain-containing protein [Ktedonobacteraceae bacterium]
MLPAIQPGARPTPLPLSFAQQRLWFLDQLEPASPRYNITGAVRLQGQLNEQAFSASIQALLQRHESLRTSFGSQQGVPCQVIAPTLQLSLPLVDLTGLAPEQHDRLVHELARQEALQPFVLQVGPLLRGWLLRTSPEHHVLVLSLHHIITDGWSMQVLISEVTRLYSHLLHQPSAPLPPLPLHYADYALWQRAWLQGERLEQLLAYWRTHLQGAPSLLSLPTDHPRPQMQSFHGASCQLRLSKSLVASFKALCSQQEVTLFMGLLAAFQILLARYSGQDDLLIGIPIANRSQAELDGVIGFFANTLVLRTDMGGNPDFRTLVRRVRQVCLQAYAHQDAPFDLVVEALQPERDLGRNPLFQVMFALQPGQQESLELEGLTWSALSLPGQQAHCDLALYLDEEGEEIGGVLEYSTDLFERERIQRMIEQWQILVEGIVAAPASPLSALPLLPPHERQQLVELNKNHTNYPADRSIAQVFEAQVERHPQTGALLFGNIQLNYEQLNQRANQLAHYLLDLGISLGDLVGIYMDHSAELIIATLAILKTGAAYVPLDLAHPPERLAFMLQDTRMKVLISQESLCEHLPEQGPLVVVIEREAELIAQEPANNPHCEAQAGELAYVIYTSGSTGIPKGVAIPQRGVNRLVCTTNYLQIEPEDRIAQASNTSFDAATLEIWGALLNGAQLIGIPKDVILSPQVLAKFLAEKQVTILFLTTSLFNQVAHQAPEAFSKLRYAIFGGEAGDPYAVRNVLANGKPEQLLNVYGPTENTCVSTSYLIEALSPEASRVPIGTPIANSEAYVLDRWLQPLPSGVPGELYIGGAGLAVSYLYRPDLTAEYFVPHPFSTEPGARLYKTGDLVCRRPDGVLEFIERLDSQVKLRGFRVELGEIEARLCQHPTVLDALVLIRPFSGEEKRLVGYVVQQPGVTPSAQELRAFLKGQLPEYMLPTSLIFLEALPLTENGKVDRKALLQMPMEPVAPSPLATLPRTPTEQLIADLWRRLLAREQLSTSDSFFELGGHSLLATRIMAQVCHLFQV